MDKLLPGVVITCKSVVASPPGCSFVSQPTEQCLLALLWLQETNLEEKTILPKVSTNFPYCRSLGQKKDFANSLNR